MGIMFLIRPRPDPTRPHDPSPVAIPVSITNPETKMLDYKAVPGLAQSKNLDKARKYILAGKKAKLAHPVNTSGMCAFTFVLLPSHCSYF